MNLSDFCFPIEERQVPIHDGQHRVIDTEDEETHLSAPYKAIVRADTNEPISIVRSSYKIVTNEELINQLLRQLAQLDTPFKVDDSHSFVHNNRMRLQITFPEVTLHDEASEIPLSLYLHNSYDMSEGVRYYFGAIRSICSNGMIFGEILNSFYQKHTSGFQMKDLQQKMEQINERLPTIQTRIDELEMQPVTDELVEDVEDRLGKTLAKEVLEDQEHQRMCQWELLNRCTNYISHELEPYKRHRYQKQVSKVFGI